MKHYKKHFYILSGIFVLILIWGILLKVNWLGVIEHNFNKMVKKSYYERLTWSLNPFVNNATTKNEIALNLLAFVPFGFLMSALTEKRTVAKAVGLSLGLSLIFETTQIFTAIGGFSTIDLITNTWGGVQVL